MILVDLLIVVVLAPYVVGLLIIAACYPFGLLNEIYKGGRRAIARR